MWRFLLVLLVAGCTPFNQILCLPSHDALLILGDIAAGTGPSELKTLTPEPAKTVVSYEVAGRKSDADLYLSGPPKPASS